MAHKNGTVFVDGKVPNWYQPIYYEKQSKIPEGTATNPYSALITSDPRGYRSWDAAAAAANALGYANKYFKPQLTIPKSSYNNLEYRPWLGRLHA